MLKRLLILSLLLLLPVQSEAARLFTCGFEEGLAPGVITTTAIWNTVNLTPVFSTTHVHSGTNAARMNPTGASWHVIRNLAASSTSGTYYTRAYVYFETIPGSNTEILRVRSGGGVTNWQLHILTTGKIRLTNVADASSTFDSTATFVADVMYRIEVRHLLSASPVGSDGQIEVRVYTGDELTALDTWGDGNFTGGDGSDADTLATNVQFFSFGQFLGGVTSDIYFDDIAINDATGSLQTTWPGPGKIALLTPSANSTVQWTPTATATNYANVDETAGPFVFSDFSGTAQYFTFADAAAHDLTAAGAFTIAAVVRADALTGNHFIVVHDNSATVVGWRYSITSAGHQSLSALGAWGQLGTATTDLVTNTWYGIAATRPAASTNVTYWRFNLGTQTMASEAINVFASTYTDGASQGVIGGDYGGGFGDLWNGQIARVGIDVGTEHTQQEITDFFNGAATTTWDSRWDLPSLTDTGTAGATLTNVSTLTNDTTYNFDAGNANVDEFTLSDLPSAVPSNATFTLMDTSARVSASASSGAFVLESWDESHASNLGPTVTVTSTTWRILSTSEHHVRTLSGKTKSNVDAFTLGYAATSGAVEKRVTAVWANVEWIESVAAGGGAGHNSMLLGVGP